jgi:peptidoglycan hydrolase-like protein with peptidoglycan-binding domain
MATTAIGDGMEPRALAATFALASVLAPVPSAAQVGNQTLTQESVEGESAVLTLSPATVRQIQQQLNLLGYDAGHVDGIWGPVSSRAMTNFQQAQGLEPTGRINLRSLTALGISPADSQSAAAPQPRQSATR